MSIVYPDRVPEVGDEVKHKLNDTYGKVIAKYPEVYNPTVIRLDVRSSEDRIHYNTPAANWVTTMAVEDLE